MRYCAIALMVFGMGMGSVQAAPPTFTKDVAPIFNEKCASCHRPNEIAPFSVLDYDTVRPWAKAIRKSVSEKSMPPWHADSSKTEFLNDRSLKEDQIKVIIDWVDQGAKKGNPKDLPDIPEFDDTWAMGKPDFIFHATTDFVVPAGEQNIRYQSVHFGPVLEEDMYITEWEIRPTERRSVHHANLVRAPKAMSRVGIGPAVLSGGDYLGSYLPGARPFSYPEGTALKLPKGNTIQIQVHYVGQDEEITDHLMFGVRLAKGRVDKLIRTVGTDNNDMTIQPHDPNFTMDAEVNINYDLTLLSSGAHMHTRGSAYEMYAILPDGTKKLIADVPRYDFNWQTNYELAKPVDLPKGSKYHVQAKWDNSDKNPNNPDPSATVDYGPWTEDEMLVTWSHVVLADEKLGYKMENGKITGRYEDAVDSKQPQLLQSLPQSMAPRKK
jgi:hypothetical protein